MYPCIHVSMYPCIHVSIIKPLQTSNDQMDLFINKISKPVQLMESLSVVSIISALCYAMASYLDYKVVAFILLLTVSIVAVLFDILPVTITAIVSALIWDYFFIPPHFTLHVGSTEDSILLL